MIPKIEHRNRTHPYLNLCDQLERNKPRGVVFLSRFLSYIVSHVLRTLDDPAAAWPQE